MKEISTCDDEKSQGFSGVNEDDTVSFEDIKPISDTNIDHIAIFLKWAAEAFQSAKNLHQPPIATTQANQENEAMSFKSTVLAHEKHITEKVERSPDKSNMFDREQLSPLFKKEGSQNNAIDRSDFLKKETDLDDLETKNIFL